MLRLLDKIFYTFISVIIVRKKGFESLDAWMQWEGDRDCKGH